MAQRFKDLGEVLTILGIEYETEHKFHDRRKWRLDYVIPDYKIALEYEGIYGPKSRHLTVGGYRKDVEKYNEAALYGWLLLRFTHDHLASGEALNILERAIGLKRDNSQSSR